jgi:hypothetical protein
MAGSKVARCAWHRPTACAPAKPLECAPPPSPPTLRPCGTNDDRVGTSPLKWEVPALTGGRMTLENTILNRVTLVQNDEAQPSRFT